MRWWRVKKWVGSMMAEVRRCFSANSVPEIRAFQDLHTHLNRKRDFTGSLKRISTMSSNRSMCVICGWRTRKSSEARVDLRLVGVLVWRW